MPEYLAPGVYVEETSFRAKSIEGVSTSTTAFIGRTRKGPVFAPGIAEETPELLTSFGDFERIYGGIDDLAGGTNQLAHAVRAFFDNGGKRLFVSRVFQPRDATDDGRAQSTDFVTGATAAGRARFVARFPGEAGNGVIDVRETATPATLRSLDAAEVGSMLRVGGRQPQTAARLNGAAGPYALPDGGQLLLTVGNTDVGVTVHGSAAEAVAGAELADPITIPVADATLQVSIDGVDQSITLPTTEMAAANLVAFINDGIRAGSAGRTTDADPPANRLILRSDRRGSDASITVRANPSLGFANDVTVRGADDPSNNVRDLLSVTAEDLNAILIDQNIAARASVDAQSGALVITSTATGAAAALAVRAGAGSQHTALGLLAGTSVTGSDGTAVTYFVKTAAGWRDQANQPLDTSSWQATGTPQANGSAIGADLVAMSVLASDADGNQIGYDELAFDRAHSRWLGTVLARTPVRRTEALENAFAAEVGGNVSPFALRDALFGGGPRARIELRNGNDGAAPTAEGYRTALQPFEAIEDISIVGAPDVAGDRDLCRAVNNEVITHVERRRAYRVGVLDMPLGLSPVEALEERGHIDSDRVAVYYPGVVVPNPLFGPSNPAVPEEVILPPSGFVCGIYARSDVERGVWKAPANEIVRGALRFERDVNFGQQELLNPRGVNCLRYFPGRGNRVWGARTATSDPEWKYVNVRRYFNYLERSIDNGTQWAVFEPNGERLWANIRETISSFLYNEFVSGALLGESPKEAFFVRCDRSTMTQSNLDNGQLVCLIGVAVVKPAEFVIFRIGQKTADARA